MGGGGSLGVQRRVAKGQTLGGMKGSKRVNVRGESLTESFCNLSLGLEMD